MVGMDGVGNMGLNAALGSIQAAAKVTLPRIVGCA